MLPRPVLSKPSEGALCWPLREENAMSRRNARRAPLTGRRPHFLARAEWCCHGLDTA
jgi:hypothetical protein